MTYMRAEPSLLSQRDPRGGGGGKGAWGNNSPRHMLVVRRRLVAEHWGLAECWRGLGIPQSIVSTTRPSRPALPLERPPPYLSAGSSVTHGPALPPPFPSLFKLTATRCRDRLPAAPMGRLTRRCSRWRSDAGPPLERLRTGSGRGGRRRCRQRLTARQHLPSRRSAASSASGCQ